MIKNMMNRTAICSGTWLMFGKVPSMSVKTLLRGCDTAAREGLSKDEMEGYAGPTRADGGAPRKATSRRSAWNFRSKPSRAQVGLTHKGRRVERGWLFSMGTSSRLLSSLAWGEALLAEALPSRWFRPKRSAD